MGYINAHKNTREPSRSPKERKPVTPSIPAAMAARQSYASVSAVMGSRDTLGVYQAMQQMRTLQVTRLTPSRSRRTPHM